MNKGYKRRARKGITFMDYVLPGKWRRYIDVETLDLGSESLCVWGQVFGSFDTGYKSILALCELRYSQEEREGTNTPWWKWITDHGFAFYKRPDEDGKNFVYPRTPLLRKRHRELTQAWIEELGTNPAIE